MARNKLSVIENQILTSRDKLRSIDKMKENELRKCRGLMLKASREGFSNTSIGTLSGTSASRIKLMLAPAIIEEEWKCRFYLLALSLEI